MKVEFFGVRGSAPASGRAFVRYGGNTSCVALSRDGESPSLVLDAGTGLRRLARALDHVPFVGTILLGHLHLDHVLGLPFFPAAEHPASRTRVLIPEQGPAEAVLERVLAPPTFPLRPAELRGRWEFAGLRPGFADIEGFSVLARDIPHGGGRTFGFRISDGTGTLAYLSDHSPSRAGAGPDGLGAYHDAARELAAGADVLVHDAQHLAAEFPAKAFLGHSAVEYAEGLAEEAGVGTLVLFHHDPDRADEELDRVVDRSRTSAVPVVAAFEGLAIDVQRARLEMPAPVG
ncbi:MAG: MBL fold metallo-hydrolase [Acidimicrobiales bacterium]